MEGQRGMLRIGAREARILLVEDNPGDVLLTQRAFKKVDLHNEIDVASDGEKALARLRQQGEFANTPLPDLILLDINLPRVNGKEVLAQLKSDDELKTIPVIMLTSSTAESDVIESYRLHANAYLSKPVTLGSFMDVVASIEEFWLAVAIIPRR